LRPGLARDLKAFRARWKEFPSLFNDAWIKTNSEIEPQRLHALGVISFRWNTCEQLLFALFTILLDLPKREAQILAHGLGSLDLINRIKVLASTRLDNNQRLIGAIENAMTVYDRCRQNRNQVTHFDTQIALGEERSSGFNLVRKTKKPDDPKRSVPFDDSLQNLRRVAREIWRLNAQLKSICESVSANVKPEAAKRWPEYRKEMVARLKPSLPLPKLLSESTRPEKGFAFPSEEENIS
jgi:hypothetical protein